MFAWGVSPQMTERPGGRSSRTDEIAGYAWKSSAIHPNTNSHTSTHTSTSSQSFGRSRGDSSQLATARIFQNRGDLARAKVSVALGTEAERRKPHRLELGE